MFFSRLSARTCNARRLPLALFALSLAAAGTAAQEIPACATAQACVQDIMAAARAGKDIQQYQTIARLKSLAGQPPGRPGIYRASAEYQRELALSHLKAGRHQEAEQLLRTALTTLPTHAEFWDQLAAVFHVQGRTDDAVSALVAAHFWSPVPAETLRNYERLANDKAFGGPRYRAALGAIAANQAAAASADAALPPAAQAGARRSGRTDARIDFSSCRRPDYPALALDTEAQGTVELAYYIDAEGKPLRAKMLRSSGHPALDNEVITTLSACGFQPAMQGTLPVGSWAKLQYVWSIE